MRRKGSGNRDADASLFGSDEIAAFADQEELVSQQQKAEDLRASVASSLASVASIGSLEQTTIDDSALKASAVPGDGSEGRFALGRRQRVLALLGVALLVVYLAVVLFPQDLLSVFTGGEGAAARFSLLFRANLDWVTTVLSGRSVIGFNGSPILVYALVALVGAGLSTVGAAYQGSFRNALATPSTLGVMSGASCGMVAYIVLHQDAALAAGQRIVITADQAAQYSGEQLTNLGYYLTQLQGALCALVGAFAVVILTMLIAKLAGRGKMSMVTLVVAGQVFAALANAVVVLFRLYLQTTGGQQAVTTLALMQTGDFSTIGTTYDLLFLGLPVALCILLLMVFSGKMNLLAFGDDEARVLGVRVGLLRGLVIALSTVMTALIVSFVGSIGFVGFLMPHMMRRLVGPDFRYLLPASALGGAVFLLVVQYLFSCLPLSEGGIGVVTTCVGAIVFLFAIVQERRVPRAEQ